MTIRPFHKSPSGPTTLPKVEPEAPPKPKRLKRHQRLLLRAADLIDQCGWVTGYGGNEDVGYCVLGALHAARGYAPIGWGTPAVPGSKLWRARQALVRELGLTAEDSAVMQLFHWNDTAARGHRAVTTALRRAAER